MSSTRKLWIALAALLVSSFSVLLWMGAAIRQNAPPMPERVVSQSGQVLYTRANIERGRTVWQSMGGMQLGSIWGHGGYVAPDWSADWLHREAVGVLDRWAQREESTGRFEALPAERQAALRGRLESRLRKNSYDPGTQTVTLDADRTAAVAEVAAHYERLFGNDPSMASLRDAYAMKNDTVANPAYRRDLTGFFWWTSWAAMTERPGTQITYTNNWPSEPLVGNRPAGEHLCCGPFSACCS